MNKAASYGLMGVAVACGGQQSPTPQNLASLLQAAGRRWFYLVLIYAMKGGYGTKREPAFHVAPRSLSRRSQQKRKESTKTKRA